jgi:ubiquinone/menaquinone biosynthesis C-methylase UbiE
MDKTEGRRRAGQLAQEHRDRGDFTGWFERLYAGAQGDEGGIPWAQMTPNAKFQAWINRHQLRGDGKSAVVIGCGLGDDAEILDACGFDVTAFDISFSAIEWCKKRFPNTRVHYVTADLLATPETWAFDFVLEIYTMQSLPLQLREQAIFSVATLVAPGGTLLVIGRLTDARAEPGKMPWPLTRNELEGFTRAGLREIQFEDYSDREDPPVRRFCAEYRR